MSHIEHEQVIVTDAVIERDRLSRVLFFILAATATHSIPAIVVSKIAGDWFGLSQFGFIAGLLGGAYLFFNFLYGRMIVTVRTQRAFLTLDLLKSFLGSKKAYVAYGPGFHFAYPWEQRIASNNVSLIEVSESFKVSVVTNTGVVEVKGSYRIRPRLGTDSLVAFLGGVAIIAEDVGDLIKSVITELLSTDSLGEVSKNIKALNAELAKRFAEHQSEFEERFGIVVGDVTVAEFALSEASMKTRNAVDEAAQLGMGVALTLGYKNMAEVNQAIASGVLTTAGVENARKQFMALSENISMEVKDWNLNITGLEGLDPETKRIAGDAARAYAAARQANSKGTKK